MQNKTSVVLITLLILLLIVLPLPNVKKRGGGFPGGSDSKESACNARDLGSTLGLGRSPGQGMATHSSSLALGIPMDSGAWKATVHGWQRVGHD